MAFKRSFRTTANNFIKTNENDKTIDLFEQLNRFQYQRNTCESLIDSKLAERYFEDVQMNDLILINKFFEFLQHSMIQSKNSAVKLLLRLPGSKLLDYVYEHMKHANGDEKDLFEEFLLNTTKILELLIDIHPLCYEQLDHKGIFDRLENSIQKTSNEEIHLKITSFISRIETFRDEIKKKQKRTIEFEVDRDDPPPDDFHQLSIYPTLDDIFHQDEPYLRKNITSGQYKNGTHYLDIHFRLLREDYLGPLREAICQYMSQDNRDISFRNSNVRLYRNAILTGSNCSNAGILFSLYIDPKFLPKSISWTNSRRLIYGNLLAATFDNFISSCFLLTVEDRSNIDKNGTIFVRCQKELTNYKLMRIPPGTSFTLLETTSYFEAYRPILQALQKIKDDKIPLEKYLLHCEKNVQLAEYFQLKSDIDFRPILIKNLDLVNQFDGEISDVKDLSTWPNAKQLGLDESQYRALELAITKSVALIQGPPGCGKTFLGVRLAELYYHNRERIIGCQRPILMICYTNHALDQFLSSIIRKLSLKPGDIVRVGGRSSHTDIEPFLIQKLRQERRRDARLRNEELAQKYEILRNIQKQIGDCTSKYYQCCQQLLNGKQLIEIMERTQFLSFIEPILGNLDIYKRHWKLSKGGVYCCRSVRTTETHENESTTSDSSEEEVDEEEEEEEEELSEYERAQRMRNRIHCRKLNDLSEDDQKEIQQLLLKWLNTTDLNTILEEIILLNQDDGEGEFRMKEDKRKKKIKEKAKDILKNIFNDVSEPSTTDEPNLTEENPVTLEEDEEELRRKENIDNSYIPFNVTESVNKKDQKIDTEQLEYMRRLLSNPSSLISENQAKNYQDLWSNSISKETRQHLYRYWLWKYIQSLIDQWFILNEQYDENHQSMQDLWLNNDLVYMEKAFIIAMTTHCASRYQKVLKQIAPRICIVEEAAEVFESHIVTAIGENIEHLILIGDHVQLRPSPNVYTLAKKFHLDVSLFERLIKNSMPSIQLTVQHRSIPMISSLTHHFYDIQIANHESVLNRPGILGVTQPLYFITHENFEENVADGASKRNSYECTYILRLAEYLLNQGYKKTEITILTTYMGQRQQFQKMIHQLFPVLKGIYVTVVDNFQGEENRIILLSLVRSNADKRLGYIGVDNRICVALSRAQEGFYVIGNFGLLVGENETWKTIVNKIKKLNLIGKGLPINCANHSDNQLICENPNDFLKRPLGGCGLKCEFRLSCGHQCPQTCHSTSHNSLKCQKPCLKNYEDCEHRCSRQCHSPNDCPPCTQTIKLKMPNCEHTSDIPCVMRKTNQIECAVKVPYTCPNGHQVQVFCRDLRDKEVRDRLCSHPCNATLECGHVCKGTCSTCLQGRFHCPCEEQELVIYICGHSRYQSCHEIGPRCEEKYFKLCDHQDEVKISGQPDQCVLYQCNRYCLNKCRHTRCMERCRNECNSGPCIEKCSRRFECEHYCNAVCGEPCILCLVCRERTLPKEIQRDLKGKNIRYSTFVELECGHLFKTDVLDKHVESFKTKTFLENGFMYIDYPRCPTCQASMVRCKHYSSLMKKIQNRIDTISMADSTLTGSQRNHLVITKDISLADVKLPESIIEIIKQKDSINRHKKLTELFVNVIKRFQNLSYHVKIECDQLLKLVYQSIEKNRSIFLTRQQWSDLENEYNRFVLIEHFRTMKESSLIDFNRTEIDVLDDILFGPNPFTKFACQICYLLLNGETEETDDKWKTILLDNTQWEDFEKDRLMCDGKWMICPLGTHLIWWKNSMTEQTTCTACSSVVKDQPNHRPQFRGRYGRGRPFR